MSKRILVIEDDPAIAEIEQDFLEIEGYHVTVCNDGLEGANQALSNEFDLILLDLMLPSIDGYEICRRIRKKTDIPLLMVTARIDEVDKIRGLGLGADDYIVKPFSPTELVARVKANIAQYERIKRQSAQTDNMQAANNILSIGDITLNKDTRRIFIQDKEVSLKNKEYELLAFLVSNPDIIFSKEHIYERIWGMDAFGDLKTVTVHINRLREKIEQDPQNPRYIETVWGAGYRFSITHDQTT